MHSSGRGERFFELTLQIQGTKVTKIGVCGFHPFDLT